MLATALDLHLHQSRPLRAPFKLPQRPALHLRKPALNFKGLVHRSLLLYATSYSLQTCDQICSHILPSKIQQSSTSPETVATLLHPIFSDVRSEDLRTGQQIGAGRRIGGLYQMEFLHFSTPSSSGFYGAASPDADLWYRRLGHASEPQLKSIPKTVGVSIPMKATFFITYIMVDGWAGVAGEILRLKPLIFFHLKNTFLVKTDQDREQAMDPGSLEFASSEPRIQLYFLLGLVYSVVTPILLPFIVVFFALSFVVFRHQIINVYNQEYESGAAFWPDVQRRLITAMIISQLLLMGLMSTKYASQSTPLLIALPVLTIWFHKYCKSRFEPAFVKFPLQDAMVKDTLERATEPNLNLKGYLQDAYIHPVFQKGDIDRLVAIDDEENNPLVPTKRTSYRGTPVGSKFGSEAGSEIDS